MSKRWLLAAAICATILLWAIVVAWVLSAIPRDDAQQSCRQSATLRAAGECGDVR